MYGLVNEQKNNEKDELIQFLRNRLDFMSKDDKFDSMSVAKVIYNNMAHYMNKTDMFSSREGEPLSGKAPFAPQN